MHVHPKDLLHSHPKNPLHLRPKDPLHQRPKDALSPLPKDPLRPLEGPAVPARDAAYCRPRSATAARDFHLNLVRLAAADRQVALSSKRQSGGDEGNTEWGRGRVHGWADAAVGRRAVVRRAGRQRLQAGRQDAAAGQADMAAGRRSGRMGRTARAMDRQVRRKGRCSGQAGVTARRPGTAHQAGGAEDLAVRGLAWPCYREGRGNDVEGGKELKKISRRGVPTDSRDQWTWRSPLVAAVSPPRHLQQVTGLPKPETLYLVI
ncbi:hypothetical protein GGX14DRAFT_391229 [Mycena pura]|uniref:Uncharacterized protein n=1 Tax=Mycena pura TaxID=153505 RepID=A0AAD6YF58_9AGAR|nr:hypothetical protein GGX14DRAFT_391229 [Mycena pura]